MQGFEGITIGYADAERLQWKNHNLQRFFKIQYRNSTVQIGTVEQKKSPRTLDHEPRFSLQLIKKELIVKKIKQAKNNRVIRKFYVNHNSANTDHNSDHNAGQNIQI